MMKQTFGRAPVPPDKARQVHVRSLRAWFPPSLPRLLTWAVLVLCTTGCVEGTGPGHAYRCHGNGICSYQGQRVRFSVPDGKVCALDNGDANTWYLADLDAWVA